jgi:hypothetical protein
MTRLPLATLLTAALLLAACTGGGDATPSATPPPTAPTTPPSEVSRTPTPTPTSGTPTETPTPTPVPRAGLYLVDVATEEWHTLDESLRDSVGGWWEYVADTVTSWTRGEGDARIARRYALDGSVIEEHEDRSYITPSRDGRSRYYSLYEDGRFSRSVLEHDGAELPIAVDYGFGSGFSPAGDRLLVGRGDYIEGTIRVEWTYWVIDVTTGAALVEFAGNASPEGTDGGYGARWSPSGRYVASSGLDGLLVHDTTDGSTIRVGVGGSPEWAPAEDALVAETDDGTLEVVRLPSLDRVPLATEGGRPFGRFDASGTAVAVSSFEDPDRFQGPIVTVYDAAAGARLARWEGGVDTRTQQFIRFSDGIAGIVLGPTEDCPTFRLFSPSLPAGGRCIDGHNPRLSADGSRIAYFRVDPDVAATLVEYDIAANEERLLGTIPYRGEIPLARWNAAGTHLLIQRSWDGIGFSDTLP